MSKPTHRSRYVTKAAVRDMIESRAEIKRVVGTTSGTTSTSGAIIYKSSFSQGDDYSGRTGDKIRIQRIEWTVASKDTNTTLTRFILVSDTSNAGVAPAVTDILSSASTFAHMNPIYEIAKRFIVLVDIVLSVSSSGNQYPVRRGVVERKFPVYFNNTGSASTDGGKNALYALVIGENATATYVITTNVWYTDI